MSRHFSTIIWQYIKKCHCFDSIPASPFIYNTHIDISALSLSLSLCPSQLDPCPLLVSGESPAETWVRVTVRDGSGRRRMQRVTSLRNGRSTGLC